MYLKVRNNFPYKENRINPSCIFSYNSKYNPFYSHSEEKQNIDVLIENYNKLNKLKIDTSISTENEDNDGGFSEESFQYSMISDLVNFESDNENYSSFNKRQGNHHGVHKKSADLNHNNLENIYFNQESPLLVRKISASDGTSSRLINSSLYELGCNMPTLSKDPEFTTKYDSLEYDILNNIYFNSGLSIEELTRNSLNLSHDQGGCRFLQKIIEQNESFTNDMLYHKLKINLVDIMNDSFGNYLIQKMIEKLNQENMDHLISVINENFLMLAKNPQGTRVIQKLIEHTNCSKINDNLLAHTLDLLKDNNGYHIVLKYSSSQKNSAHIGKIIESNILDIAKNKFGCCAIQKYLQLFPNDLIIKKIIGSTADLIVNVYGNYVIQFIISLSNQEYNFQIVEKFKSNICYLSKQKFSSNVIERCFDYCKDSVKVVLINYICEEKVVSELLMDMYGNYVLQKAISCSREPYFGKFMSYLGPLVEKLKFVSFGSKLYSKLMLSYPELKKYKKNYKG